MGVTGLSSYIRNRAREGKWEWETISLKGSTVIIDGMAVLYYLQKDIDSRYGGQYDRIDDYFENFFTCLKAMGTKMQVVFDGPSVVVAKKLQTLFHRAEETIEKCYNVSQGIPEEVDHPLSLMLLIQKLRKLEISFTVCDGEADKEIAILSKRNKWPVISSDSDFFIYDIPAGYIPLDRLYFSREGDKSEVYYRSKLAQHLGINETLLPLLASLLGNDYVNNEILVPFDQALKSVTPMRAHFGEFSLKLDRLKQLITSANHTKIDEAIKSVLGIISEQSEREILKKALLKSLDEYDITGHFILESHSEQAANDHGIIPSYVIDRYHHGNFPVRYMGVIQSPRQILKCQVQDMEQISSNNCSKLLRQTIYAILLPPWERVLEWDRLGLTSTRYLVLNEKEANNWRKKPLLLELDRLGLTSTRYLVRNEKEANNWRKQILLLEWDRLGLTLRRYLVQPLTRTSCDHIIPNIQSLKEKDTTKLRKKLLLLEWERVGLTLTCYLVQPLTATSCGYPIPNLHSLNKKDTNQRRELLLRILQSYEAVQSLPVTEQLFAASVRYWILHSKPKVSTNCIKVLLLQYRCLMESRKVYKLEPITCNTVLLHSLAQWQSVIAETLHLNKILLDAFPEPDISRLFNGVTAKIIYQELIQENLPTELTTPTDEIRKIYKAVTY